MRQRIAALGAVASVPVDADVRLPGQLAPAAARAIGELARRIAVAVG